MHRGYVGLSKSAIRHSGSRRSSRKTDVLTAGKQQERQAEQNALRRAIIEALSETDQNAIYAMDIDNNPHADAEPTTEFVPPGDEGFDISHEGGEFEVFEDLVEGIKEINGVKRIDHRTRTDRIEVQNENWDLQMARLVSVYLNYNAREEGLMEPLPYIEARSLQIETFDMFSRSCMTFAEHPGMVFANETLLQHGFLGSSPLKPKCAISLRLLACYQQNHRTCPRFSIEAQCKALCHMYKIPYNPYFATQFSVAYDAYLQILREVDRRAEDAICQETPHWRHLDACPACFYKLEDEPELEFSLLCSIDGNNSLQRMNDIVKNRTSRIDSRILESDRYVKPEDVDRFKDEVQATRRKDVDADQDDWEDVDSSSSLAKCVDRWRNAGPEQRKKMFALFEETGIFIACCRHRFVLLFCDMIKSGERAKYPLAIVNRLMDDYGPNIGCAYDIGCAFEATLRNSSLGARARTLNFRLMVGAFHGHAHNRLCQLSWHPLYIKGTGNSEGEGCEHVFSSSNNQARHTRHASRFHRLQSIQEHFSFWDEDKYASLGNFLFNHYREALNTTRVLEAELDALRNQLKVSSEDFETFFLQEKAYLEGLQNPPAEDLLKIKYVHSLDELAKFSVATDQIHRALLEARHQVESSYTRLQNSNTFVFTLEMQLGIEARWEEGSAEYKKYKGEATLLDYRESLDELERLVVQRLFELSKLGMSGTGYKLQSQIGKALQRRSEAIRNALVRYNTQAAKLDPPQPALSWKEIVSYSFLAEFDLLRLSRTDIRQAEWTVPARREGTTKYFKLCRAREEIIRLNVEMCRLRTAIRDEEENLNRVIRRLKQEDLPLCGEIQRRWGLRRQVNQRLISRLDQIEKLAGFTGRRGATGDKLGAIRGSVHGSGMLLAETMTGARGSEGAEEEEAREREEELAEVEKLTEFVENICD